MQQPIGVALRIIEERAFARAKEALDNAKKEGDVPSTPMVQLVKTFRVEGWTERMKELAEYQV